MIPVIDLGLERGRLERGDLPRGSATQKEIEIAAKFRDACVDVGFMYLTGHGISNELIDDIFFQSQKFFKLPDDKKRTVLVNEKTRGYTPLGEERLDPEKQVLEGDTKEGYYIAREVDEKDVTDVLSGGNQWPDEEELGLEGWKSLMVMYYTACDRLGLSVVRIVALSLGLEVDYFNEFFKENMSTHEHCKT
eukprot:g1457.t1